MSVLTAAEVLTIDELCGGGIAVERNGRWFVRDESGTSLDRDEAVRSLIDRGLIVVEGRYGITPDIPALRCERCDGERGHTQLVGTPIYRCDVCGATRRLA